MKRRRGKRNHLSGSLVLPSRRASASIIEVIPEGTFLTYGVGVSLKKMLDPKAAAGRVAA